MQEPHEYELAVKVAQFQVAQFSEEETVPIPLDRNNTDSNIEQFNPILNNINFLHLDCIAISMAMIMI